MVAVGRLAGEALTMAAGRLASEALTMAAGSSW